MGKSFDTLVSDIHDLLGTQDLVDPSVAEKFGAELAATFTKRVMKDDPERKPTLRMSNIGRPLRQLWYEMNGYQGEVLSGKTKFKFFYGDLIESLVLVLAEAAGHKVERQQELIEVDGIKGHIDGVIDGVLVDVKSCSPYSFIKFRTGGLFQDDAFGYIGQLSGYAAALKLPAAFIAAQKVDGDLCTLRLPEPNTYDVVGRIAEVKQGVGSDTPPPRCYPDEADGKSGNRKLGVSCSYCGHKEECWKDSNDGHGLQLFHYSTGPRWLTKVVRQPKVASDVEVDHIEFTEFPTKKEQ